MLNPFKNHSTAEIEAAIVAALSQLTGGVVTVEIGSLAFEEPSAMSRALDTPKWRVKFDVDARVIPQASSEPVELPR